MAGTIRPKQLAQEGAGVGQVMEWSGTVWAPATLVASGDVTGPASAVDNAFCRYDGTTGKIVQNGLVTCSDTGEVAGVNTLDLSHTATVSDEAVIHIVADAAGFSDLKAIEVDFITGAIGSGSDEEALLVNVDETLSTGGRFAGVVVLSTVEGLAEIDAIEVGAGVHPVKQISGTFGDLDTILDIAVDVTVALSAGGAGNVSVFENDNETLTLGDVAIFEELEFVLGTGASGSGVSPTFEFSTGVGTWTAFGPTDGTGGFKNTGIVAWLASDIPTWATGTGGEYLIRITRTKNSVATTPIIDLVQREVGTGYNWTKDGDLEIRGVQLADQSAPANPGAGLGALYKKTADDGIFWKPDAAGPEVDLTATGGGGDLAATLAIDNVTGANDIEITDGQAIDFGTGYTDVPAPAILARQHSFASAGANALVNIGAALHRMDTAISVTDSVTVRAEGNIHSSNGTIATTDKSTFVLEQILLITTAGVIAPEMVEMNGKSIGLISFATDTSGTFRDLYLKIDEGTDTPRTISVNAIVRVIAMTGHLV